MKRSIALMTGVVLTTAMLATSPTFAQSSVLGIVGDRDSNSLVTVGRGSAGDRGAVNVGVGGGGGNVVDANVRGRSGGGSGGSSLVNANVSAGSGSGASVEADVLNRGNRSAISARLGVGGPRGLVDACVNVGANCDDGTGPGNGTGPGDGTGPGNGGLMPGGGLGSSSGQGFGANCNVGDASALLQMIASASYSPNSVAQWARSANIQLIQVQHCPELAAEIRAAAAANDYQAMQQGVMSDALIQATLQRTRFNSDNIVLVMPQGPALNVYLM